MAETNDYIQTLQDALSARAAWLEKTELVKLKDELRSFQSSFSSLYAMYLKKGLIHEDPYKQENKISELEVPESTSFSDAERLDKVSIRLSNYDSQLDFLVNFYQFGADFLNLDRIKRIMGLVKYIDWVLLSPDAANCMTKAAAEMTQMVKVGVDPLALRVIGEAITTLSKSTNSVIEHLKPLTHYHREAWKLRLRDCAAGISAQEATVAGLKKRFMSKNAGEPFYPDLAEEMIKEDFSSEGPALREKVLKSLAVAEAKPKVDKPQQVSYKQILSEGLQVIGGAGSSLNEAASKLDENEQVLANRKKTFFEKLKDIIAQMLNKEPDAVYYELSFSDPVKGTKVKESINYRAFRTELDRKLRTLAGLALKGASANSKLEAATEEQLMGLLDRMIRDVQSVHRTMAALDEFFKVEVQPEDRDKIKGIKPELSTVKNSIVRANQLKHEYSDSKEEAEQMKKLGITVDISAGKDADPKAAK